MVNHAQDFVAVKKYEILQYSLIPIAYRPQFFKSQHSNKSPCHMQINYVNYGSTNAEKVCCSTVCEYLLLAVQSI